MRSQFMGRQLKNGINNELGLTLEMAYASHYKTEPKINNNYLMWKISGN